MKKLLLVLFTIYISTIQSAHAAARKPAPPAQSAAVNSDPLYQCQYCKRTFKGSEGRMMRFFAHNEEHWMCIDCFYDALHFSLVYKAIAEEEGMTKPAEKK